MSSSRHHLEIDGPTDEGGRNVLRLSGDIDLATAPGLRDRITEASTGPTTVVIDLRDVRFMDSPGLGILIYCRDVLEANGSALVARSPMGHVRQLFDFVHAEQILTIE